MIAVYQPSRWERTLAFGRKNKPKQKPQKDRGRSKGGSKPAKPPWRGGGKK